MKTLFVSLVALLFAFFLGCESTITDPVIPEPTKFVGSTEEEETAAYKDIFHNTYPYSIRLEGSLLDPSHMPNGYAEIEGVVRYGIQEVENYILVANSLGAYKTSLAGTSANKKLKVDLYVDAMFKANCPGNNHPWTVKQPDDKIIEVNSSNQAIYYFEKSFKINGFCCAPLNLVIKFQLENRNLSIVSMVLKMTGGWQSISFEQ